MPSEGEAPEPGAPPVNEPSSKRARSSSQSVARDGRWPPRRGRVGVGFTSVSSEGIEKNVPFATFFLLRWSENLSAARFELTSRRARGLWASTTETRELAPPPDGLQWSIFWFPRSHGKIARSGARRGATIGVRRALLRALVTNQAWKANDRGAPNTTHGARSINFRRFVRQETPATKMTVNALRCERRLPPTRKSPLVEEILALSNPRDKHEPGRSLTSSVHATGSGLFVRTNVSGGRASRGPKCANERPGAFESDDEPASPRSACVTAGVPGRSAPLQRWCSRCTRTRGLGRATFRRSSDTTTVRSRRRGLLPWAERCARTAIRWRVCS